MKNVILLPVVIFLAQMFLISCGSDVPSTPQELAVYKEYMAQKRAEEIRDSIITRKIEHERDSLLSVLTFRGPVINVRQYAGGANTNFKINTVFNGKPVVADFNCRHDMVGVKLLDSTIFVPILYNVDNVMVQRGWEAEILFKQ